MRRLFYAAILVTMLAIPFTSAFAAEPQVVEQISDGWWILGEIWWTPDPDWLIWFPGERVDAFMTRPSTIDEDPFSPTYGQVIWPLVTQAPIMGDWWVGMFSSEQRRMSFAEDWKYAHDWGGYYAEFMLPRDEVWFPCSYPLKWKCNYEVLPGVFEYHSPAVMAYECWWEGWNLICLDWPWVDLVWDPVNLVWINVAAPYDTISPVVIDIFNPDATFPLGIQYELEIAGYFWKVSDIP